MAYARNQAVNPLASQLASMILDVCTIKLIPIHSRIQETGEVSAQDMMLVEKLTDIVKALHFIGVDDSQFSDLSDEDLQSKLKEYLTVDNSDQPIEEN